MRIGLFTDTYLPDINGVVSSIELLRKKLVELGHDVYVICTYPGVIKVQREENIIRLPGIELKQLYGYAVTSPIHYFLYDDIEALKLDVIHAHTEFGVGIFAQMCADRFHIPLVRTYHTTYEDYTHYVNFLDLDVLDKSAKKLVAYVSKMFGEKCMCLISPSHKTEEMLLRYGIKTRIEVIPTGTELGRFNPINTDVSRIDSIRNECNIQEGYKMLLYVGRIAKEKSIDMLLDTFKMVKANNLPIKLVLIGGGPDLEQLKNNVKDNELEEYIFVGDKRPNVFIPSYYHAADAFVSASTSETQGMTYIEALASGCPIFARRDECVEELLFEDKTGFYFDDKDELYDKIIKFLTYDASKINEMSKEGQNIVKIYDANIFVDRILNVYTRAMSDYNHYYVIESISLKNDYILLKTKNPLQVNEEILVSLDTYYESGIRKGDRVSLDIIDKLKENEKETIVYRSCLKRLANRDYTVKQMHDYIINNYDISIKLTDNIIEKLIKRGLLDDKKYALIRIDSLNAKLFSTKHMINTLRKDGVPDDIIDEVVNYEFDDELRKAIKLANKYQTTIKNKSFNLKKQTIIRKLLNDGFSFETINDALDNVDFTEDLYGERDVLRKEANKLKLHYAKKYNGSALRNRVYNALASKGFNYDSIYAIINEMEWDDE